MPSVTFSPAARQDLKDIGDFIASDSPAAARPGRSAVRKRCSLLADTPLSGRQRPELHAQLRSVLVWKYVIFYTADSQRVRIERILHGARDIDSVIEGFESN